MRFCLDEVEALAKVFQLWLRHKSVLEKTYDRMGMLSSSFLKRRKEHFFFLTERVSFCMRNQSFSLVVSQLP